MRTFRLGSLLTILAFGLIACHTRPPVATPLAQTAPSTPLVQTTRPPAPPRLSNAAYSAPAPAPLSETELFRRKSLDELNAEHPLADAFFDYNQASLRDDARTALEQDAVWLAKWPSTKIRIDGHCDERGTAEYNLALGERRADMVRDYLVSLEIDTHRITTESLGKEQPFCTQDNEACWSQNRRGHFVIIAK